MTTSSAVLGLAPRSADQARVDRLEPVISVVPARGPGAPGLIASLLALTAWQGGDGALANLAPDRALANTPSYRMALLLREALAAGAPPKMAAPTMTPEQAAASYARTPGQVADVGERADPSGPGPASAPDDL